MILSSESGKKDGEKEGLTYLDEVLTRSTRRRWDAARLSTKTRGPRVPALNRGFLLTQGARFLENFPLRTSGVFEFCPPGEYRTPADYGSVRSAGQPAYLNRCQCE